MHVDEPPLDYVDRLGGYDDIDFETCENGFVMSLTDFVSHATLSCEQAILDQVNSEGSTEFLRLQKESFLRDVKRFIYIFCTTG